MSHPAQPFPQDSPVGELTAHWASEGYDALRAYSDAALDEARQCARAELKTLPAPRHPHYPDGELAPSGVAFKLNALVTDIDDELDARS